MPIANELSLLAERAPAWARLLAEERHGAAWLASPPLPSGTRIASFALRIWLERGYLTVSELSLGDRLPEACPELHINGDGSFCIGRKIFGAGDPAGVDAFWQTLGEYLVNQNHARRRGFWPPGRWLSHGPVAADKQIEAEAEAEQLGWSDEYAAALENGEGWLAGPLPTHSGSGRVRLAGAACPRGCCDAEGHAIPLKRCRHRAGLSRLIEAEVARRVANDGYISMLRRTGRTCCGRIAHCPLRLTQEAA